MSFTDTEVQEIIDEYNKEIEQLKLKIDRLVSRGIEDLRYENEELSPRKEREKLERIGELEKALISIANIKDEMQGGDWDEIEKARNIAKEALK